MSNYFVKPWFVLILFAGLVFNANSAIAQLEQQITTALPRPFDVASVNGTWKPTKGKLAGRELPKEQLESILLKVNKGTYETHGTGFVESGKLVIRIPETDKPQAIDVVIEKGDNAGMTMEGIIRIEGEKLIVCYAVAGERPTSFESGEDAQTLLLEYQSLTSLVPRPTNTQETEEAYRIGDDSGK